MKLFARGGQLGLGELTDTGDIAFVPLERIRIHRARSKAGTYRWYSDHRLPDEHGGGTITVRLHGNADPGRPVNLHVRVADSPGWRYALAVRDHLRADPGERADYLAVKRRIAATAPTTREYAVAKEPWFDQVWPRLLRWIEETGWQP